ncbi:MAG: hypothetical protein HPY79_10845 [Bacteroidales bacterium]|nr:hypothetical protein [Bacteroidales bacterium]
MEQLKEGKAYIFFVEKILKLPDDDYFVLVDEWNRKYLLTQKFYKNYNIEIGKKITCYVNKINCNGKIFLEPEHPIYKVGNIDIFIITKLEERIKQKSKEPYFVALAQNNKTNKAAVINYTDFQHKMPFTAKCEVIKIKKAEVLLRFIEIHQEPH